MSWDFQTDRPIYSQIIDHISQKIICGEYMPGYRLPSVRDMANQAGVNPNTMQRALSELEKTGLVRVERTAGRYVTEDEELLQQTKSHLAEKQIEAFFNQMRQLGVEPEQALALAQRYVNEKK
ncbi:MAG: GntR family transcriptional regulator [Firmicutes bacterium]|nr:GntR family transcriptional regulator [Bacillota bacterium]